MNNQIKNVITSLVLSIIDLLVQLSMFSPTPLQILLLLVYNFGVTFVIMFIVEAIVDFVVDFVKEIIIRFKQKKEEDKLTPKQKLLLSEL